MSRPMPTADDRVRRAREERDERLARELQKTVIELLADRRFRLYMAHLVYGKLGLTKGTWRANAGETAKAAARQEAAAEILRELSRLDPQGYIVLEHEHVNRMAEELELLASISEE